MPQKILIVEDEPLLREMYQQKFEQADLLVVTAEDGEQGLEMIKKEQPDLVLLDILLPKESGIDLLKKVRQDEQLAGTKVVAFSNFDDPHTKGVAFGLGISDYLIKTNFTPKEVLDKIKKHLQG